MQFPRRTLLTALRLRGVFPSFLQQTVRDTEITAVTSNSPAFLLTAAYPKGEALPQCPAGSTSSGIQKDGMDPAPFSKTASVMGQDGKLDHP